MKPGDFAARVRSAVRRVPRKQVSRYGIVVTAGGSGPLHEVTDFVEKPDPQDAPSDLASIGRYVLAPESWDKWSNIPQVAITQASSAAGR